MPSWKQVERSFRAIKSKVGNPPIMLVRPSEFYKMSGHRLGGFCGMAAYEKEVGYNIITVKRNRSLEQIKDTLWHEVGHILFPSKPHWWIECYATKMNGTPIYGSWAKGNGKTGSACGRYSLRYCKTKDDLPSKAKLLELSKRSTRRLYKKWEDED